MEIGEIQEILRCAEKITFSKHFYDPKVQIRGISEEEIKNNIRNPDKMISFEDQGEDSKGHRYALSFSKSNKYDLRIVISIKDKNVNVITTHIQNIKKRMVLEKWLKKQR
jgi:hypothetical protein